MMRGNQGEEALAIGKRLRAIRRAQNATLADVSAGRRFDLGLVQDRERPDFSQLRHSQARLRRFGRGIEDIVSATAKSQLSGARR
jgi:hypothetical protein